MKTAELLDLLREALPCIDRSAAGCRTTKTLRPVTPGECNCVACDIDAALAERQDSATDVVEWRLGDDCDEEFVYYEAYPDSDTGLDVVRFLGGKWRWTMSREKQGYCDTLAEAKTAAIAAARGLR